MRLAVLDIGSNTVHLLIVDAQHGGAPIPAYSEKSALRLAEYLKDDGSISASGTDRLLGLVVKAREAAEEHGAEELLAFATSAVREAPNGPEVLDRVMREAQVTLEVLPGEQEARLTFLAVRRWFGWSAGTILGLDIGGGSLEIALGPDEEADYAISLPFGAGRMTRDFLTDDPPSADQIKQLRRHVMSGLSGVRHDLNRFAMPNVVVGSSKTFRTLAKTAAHNDMGGGTLTKAALDDLVEELKGMPISQRTQLPGVSEARAPQILAGAVVAQATMSTLQVESLMVCPWALREGIILRRMDTINETGRPMTGQQLAAPGGDALRLGEPAGYLHLPKAEDFVEASGLDHPGGATPGTRG